MKSDISKKTIINIKSEKEDEIYLVRESDNYIREVLKLKSEIKEEEDLNELIQFY